jgi:hypothetical protein
LAASTSESEVAVALALVLENGTPPTYDAVRALVQTPRPVVVPELTPAVVDLRVYDQLLDARCAHG